MRPVFPVIGLIACALAAGPAAAQSRLDVRDMSCAEAAETVAAEGVAVVVYGDGLYKRVVAHLGHCDRSNYTRPFFAPTADDDQCFVGYRCVHRPVPGRG